MNGYHSQSNPFPYTPYFNPFLLAWYSGITMAPNKQTSPFCFYFASRLKDSVRLKRVLFRSESYSMLYEKNPFILFISSAIIICSKIIIF